MSQLGALYSEYQLIFSGFGFILCIGVVVWVIASLGLGNAVVDRGTRPQIEFRGKTTGAWLDLEKEGKARKNESMWSTDNQAWLNIEKVIQLDFAALPELFEALTNSQSRRLAEAILNNRPSRESPPEGWGPAEEIPNKLHLVDLEPGFKHTDPLVHKYAAKMCAYYEGDKQDILPFLEKIAGSPDEEAAAAARETIKLLAEKAGVGAAK